VIVEDVVLDASAVVALVGSGSRVGAQLAARLTATDRSVTLHAPAILPVEVDSAIRGRLLGGRLTPAQASAARRSAGAMPVELWPWDVVADRAWELRANLTTYDAGYVALAEHLGAPLITGDARIARSAGIRCVVEVFG
jgi:predicted nucleic acid-binding protein